MIGRFEALDRLGSKPKPSHSGRVAQVGPLLVSDCEIATRAKCAELGGVDRWRNQTKRMVQEPFRSVSDPSGRTKLPNVRLSEHQRLSGAFLVVFVLCTSARNAFDGRLRALSQYSRGLEGHGNDRILVGLVPSHRTYCPNARFCRGKPQRSVRHPLS